MLFGSGLPRVTFYKRMFDFFDRSLRLLAICAVWAALAPPPAAGSAGLADFIQELDSMRPRTNQALSDPRAAGEVINQLDAAEGTFAHFTTVSGESVPELRKAYDLLEGMLGGLYETYRRKHDACLTAIGNGASDCDYTQLEQLELRALYPLSWLRFHGSILFDNPGVRRRILNQAIAGFTQSALIILSPDLIRENLLGRAYCERDLGQFDRSHYNKAIADFREVMRAGPGTAQYRAAQQGLATTYAAMGDVRKAAELTSRMAQTSSGSEAQGAEMFRLQELFRAEAEATEPARRAELHRELISLLRKAYGNSKDWSLALAAVVRDVPDPTAEFGSSKDPFEQYLLAEALAATHRQLAAAKYYLAAARSGNYPQGYKYAVDIYYEQGKFDLAGAPLEALAGQRHGPMSEWAAYMRFKIARTLWERSQMRDRKLDDLWISRAREYLDNYPHGKYAYEPRFRLAELLQNAGKYSEAAAQYDLVKGDPFYAFAATFKAAQCRYLMLAAAPDKRRPLPAGEAKALAATAIAGFNRTIASGAMVENQTPSERRFVHTARGQATYMLAAMLEAQPRPDYDQVVRVLSGFETDYPEMSANFDDVARWRLSALEQTRQYAAAQAQIAALLAPGRRPPPRIDDLKALGLDLWKQSQARAERGDREGALADARLTEQLYSWFETRVADGKMDARSLTGTLSILGQAYVMMGEPARARMIFEQVVKAAPASPDANAGLARLAQADKDYRQASELWARVESEAAESDDLWYEARYNLALIYADDGNRDAACRKLAETRSEHPSLGRPAIKQRWDGLQRKLCLHQALAGKPGTAERKDAGD